VEYTNIEDLRRKYPKAFARSYEAAAGLRLERVLEK
jgi:hypothetical protein